MSEPAIRPAPVRKSIVVSADVDRSFSAFTGGIGRWWPRSRSIGSTAQVDGVLEGRPGGRWYRRGVDGAECERGKERLWEPPAQRLPPGPIGCNWKDDPALVTQDSVTCTHRRAN